MIKIKISLSSIRNVSFFMVGFMFFIVGNVNAASTYTAKVPAAYLSSSWGTGNLECSNTTRPEGWYESNGRCGEDAGNNYWNNSLNVNKYTAKVSGAQGNLKCGDATLPSSWYGSNGRCGDEGGLGYWNTELKTKTASVVKSAFNSAYSSICASVGAGSNYELCNDKLLCLSGDEYIDNTDKCEPVTAIKATFDKSYKDTCQSWFGTSNYEICNDKLLCKSGDEYLDNTNLCESSACVPSNSACAANTYEGSSCWDGCAFIAGTKPYDCTGSIPAGYTMCASDNLGLISSVSWLGVGTTSTSCTATRKCEYYGGSGGGGGSFTCTGSIPAGYTMCASDDTGLSSDLSWLGVGATSTSCTATRKCEYYGGSGGFTCTGSIPAGYTMCASDDTGLSVSLAWLGAGTTSTSCTATRKCEYYGGSGGGGSFSCTDAPPAGASFCPGDDSGLTSDLSWKQVTSCTGARKCEYVWNCAPNIVTPGFKECAP